MPKYSSNLNIDGYMSDEVDYHLDQLIISGLIDAAVIRVKGPQGRPIWDIQRVTWSGHDFLLLSREPKIWPEAKKKFIAEGGTLAFNAVLRVMFELGKTEVQKLLGG